MNAESAGGKLSSRRGRRIARRLPLMLHWREPQGTWREIPAETRMLSRYGCLLACPARIKLSDEVMVWRLEKMHYTQARVVFRSVSATDDSVEIAVEFLDNDDFWELDFFRNPIRSFNYHHQRGSGRRKEDTRRFSNNYAPGHIEAVSHALEIICPRFRSSGWTHALGERRAMP